jgi:hypothetical protein
VIKRNLKIGDMIVASLERDWTCGILTKQTKKYWYYFFESRICRIHKEKLWRHIDTRQIRIKRGSSLKRRKKQTRYRILDLHGVRYIDVDEKTRQFLNWVELPTRIITGDSQKMKAVVEDIIKEYGWYMIQDSSNFGEILVLESKP